MNLDSLSLSNLGSLIGIQPVASVALAVSATVVVVGSYYWLKGHQQLKSLKQKQSSGNRLSQSFDINTLEQNGYLLATPGKILAQHLDVEPKIKLILAQSALDQQACDWLKETLYGLVELVQLLPASESHHHSAPGGLARHTIEVANIACRIRRGRLLPKGVSQEERTAEQHRWTVAIILAACMHDAGKVISDVSVDGLSRDGREIKWNPSGGTMVQIGIDRYRVKFAKHNYGDHVQLGADLLPLLCPKPLLNWLAANASLMTALRGYLSGERDTTLEVRSIAEIVTKADQASVKLDIGQGAQARFTVARNRPVIEIMMEALNHLLTHDALKINQSGGAAFVYENDIFIVSKTVADRVRDWVSANHTQYAVSLPTDNERMFSIWQDFGQLVPTPDNRAVWTCSFSGKNTTGNFNHKLTVLRFPLNSVYAHEKDYPVAFSGQVAIENTWDKEPSTKKQNIESSVNGQTTNDQSLKQSNSLIADSEATSNETQHLGADEQTQSVELSLMGESTDNAQQHEQEAMTELVKKPLSAKPNPNRFKKQTATTTVKNESTSNNSPQATVNKTKVEAVIVIDADADPFASYGTQDTLQPLPMINEHNRSVNEPLEDDDPFSSLVSISSNDTEAKADDVKPMINNTLDDEDVREEIEQQLTNKTPVFGVPISLAAPKMLSGNDEPEEVTKQFIYWLQNSLAQGSITYNIPKAPVQFLDKGIGLISPTIFQQFCVFAGFNSDQWRTIQASLLRSNLIVRKENGDKLFRYAIKTNNEDANSKRRTAVLNVILLANPHKYVHDVPKSNPFMEQVPELVSQ